MSQDSLAHAANWIYEGVWGILARWFKTPRQPPVLPVAPGDATMTLRPSEAWLRYLKVGFWITLGFWNTACTVVLIALLVSLPPVGVLLIPAWFVVVGLPNAIAYVGMYLRYDSTWYVLSSRSMRIRRGLWIVSETTITYDNIQNVSVTQGPLERYFGIANVVVQTAGGGGHAAGPHGAAATSTHVGLLEGLTNAHEIRELILGRVRRSTDAGLGDDHPAPNATQAAGGFGPEHVRTLREIRDALAEAAR